MGIAIHKTNYKDSAVVNDKVTNYRNTLLDNLDKPIDITFSTPSLVKKHNTSFTANDSNIKKETRLHNKKT